MSNVPYLHFTMLNMIVVSIWATAIGLSGYYFGQAVGAILGDIKHYEIELIALIILASVFFWVIHFYRRRHSAGSDN
jgi:membrane protein DedA with SNARE-associated domain